MSIPNLLKAGYDYNVNPKWPAWCKKCPYKSCNPDSITPCTIGMEVKCKETEEKYIEEIYSKK